MTTQTLTLTEFLLARIAEDEADAGGADADRLWRWSQHDRMVINDAGHMQRFTPGRMLAECEAKRRIVAQCAEGLRYDVSCGEGHYGNFEVILAALALPYADHPDYREEWRP